LQFCPHGWCQRQLLAIAQNTAFFSLLGTNFGGDSVSTFALPDLRSRAPIGYGQGQGLSDYPIGESGGLETVAVDLSSYLTHSLFAAGSPAKGRKRQSRFQPTTIYSARAHEIQGTKLGSYYCSNIERG
jgi:microcystin-dependent protein